ncbi:MAG: hypothetical protein K2K97_02380, partial [Muribaculaceae bacterium]|nr:hypothetical protein [Muribaculaceae bacterium]
MKLTSILSILSLLISLNSLADIRPVKVNISPYSSLEKDPSTQSLVGTLNGSSSVNLFGEPFYQMPLLLPEGAGGFTPQLTLISEPSLGWGELGWNVTLSGISTIVRNDNDEYMLDGTVLKEYSDGVYYPEYDNITKVEFSGNNSFPSAVATTIDGIKTTYGAFIKGENKDESYTLMW